MAKTTSTASELPIPYLPKILQVNGAIAPGITEGKLLQLVSKYYSE
jgi:hypothetical protein